MRPLQERLKKTFKEMLIIKHILNLELFLRRKKTNNKLTFLLRFPIKKIHNCCTILFNSRILVFLEQEEGGVLLILLGLVSQLDQALVLKRYR